MSLESESFLLIIFLSPSSCEIPCSISSENRSSSMPLCLSNPNISLFRRPPPPSPSPLASLFSRLSSSNSSGGGGERRRVGRTLLLLLRTLVRSRFLHTLLSLSFSLPYSLSARASAILMLVSLLSLSTSFACSFRSLAVDQRLGWCVCVCVRRPPPYSLVISLRSRLVFRLRCSRRYTFAID